MRYIIPLYEFPAINYVIRVEHNASSLLSTSERLCRGLRCFAVNIWDGCWAVAFINACSEDKTFSTVPADVAIQTLGKTITDCPGEPFYRECNFSTIKKPQGLRGSLWRPFVFPRHGTAFRELVAINLIGDIPRCLS